VCFLLVQLRKVVFLLVSPKESFVLAGILYYLLRKVLFFLVQLRKVLFLLVSAKENVVFASFS
jgi:hypothetical protein